ncbi:hypothetical protein ACO2Q8_13815 [Larkinella sp. VNQ87]|uniref:hypothetical protein n=1 Tax=Larkinella sp. VNQ87 TaxID=3400921 RepID=UPI003C0C4B1E
MKQLTKPSSWSEYALVYGLIAVSGIEFFYRSQEYVVLLFLAACLVAMIRKTALTMRPLVIILAVFLLEQLQAVQFSNFVPTSIIAMMIRLAVVYLIMHICGLKTVRLFVDIIYVTALISLPIYVLTFVPGAESFMIENIAKVFFRPIFHIDEGMYTTGPTILIYNFNPFAFEIIGSSIVKRNSGPFWEPGAFGVMLNLAIALNTIRRKSLINKQNVWMMLALATTLSTAGYVTLFIIAIGYLLTNRAISDKTKLAYLLLLVPAAGIFYSRAAFMEEKIQQNISLTREDNTSRFGSAYLDLIDLGRSPFIGFGRLAENRFGQAAVSQDLSIHRNNGVTSLLITYGVPAALLYFTLLFLFFWRYCKRVGFPVLFAVFAFLSVLSSGFSQVIFDRAMLLAFLFLADRLRQIQAQKPAVTPARTHLTNSQA